MILSKKILTDSRLEDHDLMILSMISYLFRPQIPCHVSAMILQRQFFPELKKVTDARYRQKIEISFKHLVELGYLTKDETKSANEYWVDMRQIRPAEESEYLKYSDKAFEEVIQTRGLNHAALWRMYLYFKMNFMDNTHNTKYNGKICLFNLSAYSGDFETISYRTMLRYLDTLQNLKLIHYYNYTFLGSPYGRPSYVVAYWKDRDLLDEYIASKPIYPGALD